MKESIKELLEDTAISYGIELDEERSYKASFVQLIEKLSANGQVVILIDEYDKPMIEHLEAAEIERAKQTRRVLKNFFSVIKASDAFTHFVFITGVSKFSRVSIFSDLNNLRDITLSRQFATLLGYTDEELQHYFEPYLAQLSAETGLDRDRLLVKIREWYNGYSWDSKNFVYNPFSILNLFVERSFENFWFSTGTPTFLTRLIKQQESDIVEFENLPVNSYVFDSYDIDNLDITVLLFQTGYLTVKKITVDDQGKTYELSYPNLEVRSSFLTHLLGEFTQKKPGFNTLLMKRISAAVQADDMDRFVRELKTLFVSIPQPIFLGDKEAYYHSIIYLALRLTGAEVRVEDPTNIGRIDAVLETGKRIYIMEFKMGSEQKALEQIKEKKYYEKYQGKGKEIILMGAGFDAKERNIGNYLLESAKL